MSNEANEVTDDTNPIDIALLGGKVFIGKDGKILSKSEDTEYRVVLRSPTRTGGAQSSRSRGLKACKGLKGCEFAECAEKAFGTLPKNLKGLCLTVGKKE
jgi:hypothetical protein